MDARARQRLGQAFGQRLAAGAEGDDGDLPHAPGRLRPAMISEK